LVNHPNQHLRLDSRANLHQPSANRRNLLRHSVSLHNRPQPLALLDLGRLRRRIHLQQLLRRVVLDSLLRRSDNHLNLPLLSDSPLNQHLLSDNHPSQPPPLVNPHNPLQLLVNPHSLLRVLVSLASQPQHLGSLRSSPHHLDSLHKQVRPLVSQQRSGKRHLLSGRQANPRPPSANLHNHRLLLDNQVNLHLALANRDLGRVRPLLSDSHRHKPILSVLSLQSNIQMIKLWRQTHPVHRALYLVKIHSVSLHQLSSHRSQPRQLYRNQWHHHHPQSLLSIPRQPRTH
jgi:hypothetical protein